MIKLIHSASDPLPPPNRRRAFPWPSPPEAGLVVLSFAALVVFARLLTPTEVGLAALALAVVELLSLPAEMLSRDGLSRRAGPDESRSNTTFTVSTALGLGVAALCWTVEPILAGGLIYSDFALVLAWTALSLPAAGFTAALTARSSGGRRLDSLAAQCRIARSVSFGMGIALALVGAGVWAMVVQHLLQVWLSAAVFWVATTDHPRFRAAWSDARDLVTLGEGRTGALALEWVVPRLILLQIGAALGTEAAGQFSLATRIVDGLRATSERVPIRPALTLLLRLRDRPRLLRAAWQGATEITCAGAFPLLAVLAVTAPQTVQVIFGPQWRPAVPLVMILAIMAMLPFARLYAMPVLMEVGRPRDALRVRLTELPSLLLIGAGVTALVGAVWVYTGRTLLGLPVEVRALSRTTGMTAWDQFRRLWPLAALATAMALALGLIGALVSDRMPGHVVATQLAASLAIWPALLTLFRLNLLHRIVGLAVRATRG